MKQEYKIGETNLKEALKLAIKILSKTLDTNKLTSDKSNLKNENYIWVLSFQQDYINFLIFKVEIATLVRENDKTRIRILTDKELNELIKAFEEEQAKLEAEKVAKEKAAQQSK